MSRKLEGVRKELARILADKGIELVTEVDKGLQNKQSIAEIEKKAKKTLSELDALVCKALHGGRLA